ncbi:hypothetical protein GCM10009007_03010 [Formosimonas limnophila]|uniref:Uncharacterized protein n=1 Tax=Formosimonas limnophila TaxID=1384487 RepID=A0A8J3FZU0_9BURK|nr:hypothetical protein [Formosimonas limnophila]GHA65968.1 hypothetical protein GCM10009007_03010 [Formosimonas limnophila]
MDAHQTWLETDVYEHACYHEVTQKNALAHATEFDKSAIVDDAMAQDWDMQAAHELIGSIVHGKDDAEIARLARAMFAKAITDATSLVAQKYL